MEKKIQKGIFSFLLAILISVYLKGLNKIKKKKLMLRLQIYIDQNWKISFRHGYIVTKLLQNRI